MTSFALMASLAAALLPSAPAEAVKIKPAQDVSGTVIVKVLPGAHSKDSNYILEGETPCDFNADARFEEMKKTLNERFSKMFELKASLEKNQAIISAKWDEYYAMNTAYQKELKKLVADWVTDNMYAK